VSDPRPDELELERELVLGDLLNHVLDKGVVIAGDVTISVADIDLVRVGLSVFLSSVETVEQRQRPIASHVDDRTERSDADLSVLSPDPER
jgi:hypothetical protein